ncbi:MAG: hypothetical protein ABID61_00170 [Candidatus Micrarchaeota archaeon]
MNKKNRRFGLTIAMLLGLGLGFLGSGSTARADNVGQKLAKIVAVVDAQTGPNKSQYPRVKDGKPTRQALIHALVSRLNGNAWGIDRQLGYNLTGLAKENGKDMRGEILPTAGTMDPKVRTAIETAPDPTKDPAGAIAAFDRIVNGTQPNVRSAAVAGTSHTKTTQAKHSTTTKGKTPKKKSVEEAPVMGYAFVQGQWRPVYKNETGEHLAQMANNGRTAKYILVPKNKVHTRIPDRAKEDWERTGGIRTTDDMFKDGELPSLPPGPGETIPKIKKEEPSATKPNVNGPPTREGAAVALVKKAITDGKSVNTELGKAGYKLPEIARALQAERAAQKKPGVMLPPNRDIAEDFMRRLMPRGSLTGKEPALEWPVSDAKGGRAQPNPVVDSKKEPQKIVITKDSREEAIAEAMRRIAERNARDRKTREKEARNDGKKAPVNQRCRTEGSVRLVTENEYITRVEDDTRIVCEGGMDITAAKAQANADYAARMNGTKPARIKLPPEPKKIPETRWQRIKNRMVNLVRFFNPTYAYASELPKECRMELSDPHPSGPQNAMMVCDRNGPKEDTAPFELKSTEPDFFIHMTPTEEERLLGVCVSCVEEKAEQKTRAHTELRKKAESQVPQLNGNLTLDQAVAHDNGYVRKSINRFMQDGRKFQKYMEEEGNLANALRRFMVEQKMNEMKQLDMVFKPVEVTRTPKLTRNPIPSARNKSNRKMVFTIDGKTIRFGNFKTRIRDRPGTGGTARTRRTMQSR